MTNAPDDLVERLNGNKKDYAPWAALYRQAAAEITRLRERVAELERDLQEMTADRNSWEQQNDDRVSDVLEQAKRAERAEQRVKKLEAQIANRS